ncbi:MAG TPA: hypothetical protein VFH80_27725 [Solirubrobacteraceae bacterium]|nr:hypothetical protein [Solirubrobacteraceae bacterium]
MSRSCLTVMVVAGCALLAACGSTGQPSGTATGAASSAPGGADPLLKLARCMRAHGVTNFPDPSANGLQIPSSINPKSPAFRSAQQACKQFLPNQGAPPATSPRDRAAALKLSQCMRSHGVPQFPDPAFSPPRNARAVLVMRGMVFAIPTSVEPNSPAFQHASHACGFGLP